MKEKKNKDWYFNHSWWFVFIFIIFYFYQTNKILKQERPEPIHQSHVV